MIWPSTRVELVVPVTVEDWDNWRVLSLVVGWPELVGRSLERLAKLQPSSS